jgi:glycosyltransferase involved in cell wall biosynthesis
VQLNTRNRPHYAAMMLASLASQDYEDWDLLIADGGDDPLEAHEHCARLLAAIRHQHRVRVIRDRGLGIPQTYQLLMEASGTEFCFREEDDIILGPGCLRILMHHISDPGVGAVAPSTPNWNVPRASPLPLEMPNGFYRQPQGDVPGFPQIWCADDGQRAYYPFAAPELAYEVCTLHAGAVYRKSAVQAAGGFSAHFSPIGHREETHVWCRVYRAHYRLLVAPAARVWHFEATAGGSRTNPAGSPERRAMQVQDEVRFQADFAQWLQEPGREHRPFLVLPRAVN